MTAPEPVEVGAAELAATEEVVREAIECGDLWRIDEVLPAFVAEYDRRGALLAALMDGLSPWLRDGEPPAPGDDEIRASVEQMNDDFTEASNGWAITKADLARALPVVEAAGALVEHLGSSPSWKFGSGLTSESVELISRLGIAVRAAREPRTGEQ